MDNSSILEDKEIYFTLDPVDGQYVFIKFPFYDEVLVECIKGIPSAGWIKSDGIWEIRFPLVRVFIDRLKKNMHKLSFRPIFKISPEIIQLMDNNNFDIDMSLFKTSPYNHQVETVRYGLKNKKFILGSSMGCLSGKTKVYIREKNKPGTIDISIRGLYNRFCKDPEEVLDTTKLKVLSDGLFKYISIHSVIYSGAKETIKLKTELGKEIILTRDHEVLTPKGFIQAGLLTINNEVIISNHFTPGVDKIISIEDYGVVDTYDIKLVGDIHNFVANGIVVHNCGKSMMAANIAVQLRKKQNLKRVLIICGVAGNVYNWYNEIHTHTNYHAHILGSRRTKDGKIISGSVNDTINDLHNLPNDMFLIINIEKLRGNRIARKKGQRKSISHFPVVELIQNHINNSEIGMIILDEAHRVRTPTAYQTQALLWLQCERQIAMSGTIVMNGALDLYVPFKWMGWEHRDYYHFTNKYAIKDFYGSIIGYQHVQELIDVLNCYQIRHLLTEVVDLPPKIQTIEYVELTRNEWKIYAAVQAGIFSSLEGEVINPADLKEGLFHLDDGSNPLVTALRLRQVTADTSIVSDIIQESSKMNRMEEIVEEVIGGENQERLLYFLIGRLLQILL